ncbi:MAG: FeoB-associated Cys-rich membrane protein [Clostridiaceae bacterium]
MFEKIVTGIIVILTLYIIFKTVKNKKNGKCNCSDCSAHCPNYTESKNSKKK